MLFYDICIFVRRFQNPVRTGGFRPGAPDWDDISITVKTPFSQGTTQTMGILKG